MIHHGDLFDVLPTLEADSIEAAVTDPPYELGFMSKHWDASGVAFNVETWREVYRVLKPGAHLCAFGGTRGFHRMTCAIEDAGFEIRDCLSWLYGSGFPKSLDVSKAIDARAGAVRDVIGYDASRARPNRLYEGGAIGNIGGTGKASDRTDNGATITEPSTDAAKQWSGWGTALKPAWEPIILARKPFPGSVAANVLAHGTGAIHVDACRIGMSASDRADYEAKRESFAGLEGRRGTGWKNVSPTQSVAQQLENSKAGRWPANVLLDERAAAVLDAATWDIGGASRYYYIAKPSREERDYGCEALKQQTAAELTGRKPGRDVNARVARNSHPTVKPIEVMRWLVKLITPIGGTVLDPFTGSGTTGMACRYEDRKFIGIERDAEYVAIAEARIAAVAPLFGETA